MDKTGIIVISICVVLLGWWFWEQEKVAQQQAWYQQTNQVARAQSQLAQTNGASATASNGITPSMGPAPAAPVTYNTNTPEQLLVVTDDDVRYTFTSRGGGLKLVELLKYPETVSARWKTKDG